MRFLFYLFMLLLYALKVFTPTLTDGFPLILNVSKSPQVTKTLLGIQADFIWVVVWMILILSIISSSSYFFSRYLVTVPRAQSTSGITVTNMFHNFFSAWQFPVIMPLLTDPLWPGVLVPARIPSLTQIDPFSHLLKIISYLKSYDCMQIISY